MNDEIIGKLEEILKGQNELLKVLESVGKPIFVQLGDKKKILRVNEISFITTNPKGLDIYTTDGNKYINFDSISQVAEDFKDDLRIMKTHKSFIVNLNEIDSIKVISGGRELTFKGLNPDITAKITSDALEEFQKRFGKD